MKVSEYLRVARLLSAHEVKKIIAAVKAGVTPKEEKK